MTESSVNYFHLTNINASLITKHEIVDEKWPQDKLTSTEQQIKVKYSIFLCYVGQYMNQIQPIKALELVNPCQKSVYTKSLAPMKNACKPFSAPDITAVS